MSPDLKARYRPSIRAVFALMLLIAVATPLVGLFFFRVFENQLIRKTEGELIAQSAALAAVYRREVQVRAISPDVFGAEAPEDVRAGYEVVFSPYGASLDLARDPVLPPRPAPGAAAPPDPAYAELGGALAPVIDETRRRTLAAIQLLDPQGVLLTGPEAGGDLSHVPEVAEALSGLLSRQLRTRLRERPPPLIYAATKGASLRIFIAFPVILDGRVAGVVYASRTPAHVLQVAWAERRSLAFAALATLGAVLLLGLIAARAITWPIGDLTGRTRRVAAGDRAALVPLAHAGTREIAELSEAFLRTSAKLQDRSASTAAFAAHVSHELKSPLTAIQGAAELIRDADAMCDADRRGFLGNIVSDAERMTALVRRLLELARAETNGATGAATVAQAIEAITSPLTLSTTGAADAPLAIPKEKLSAILGNLADNAARHDATRLDLSVEASAGRASIRVADDGAGVSTANGAKIFDPFFTTRRAKGGTGMGLSIVRALVEAHGGEIKLIESERGATFEVELPRA